MAVSRDEVERIATLARVRPGSDEIERLTRDLNGILEHIRTLEDLDLSEFEEGSGSEAREAGGFRDPALGPDPLAGGAPGSIAPDWRDGFFVVPRLPALDAGDGEADT